MGANAGSFRHDQGLADTGGMKPGQQTQDDIGPVGNLQIAGMGHNAANITRRYRVGDDADAW